MSDEWLCDQLSALLEFQVPQDMIDYIRSITNARDLEDYMKTLLDFDNPHHKRFLQELLQNKNGNGVGYMKSAVEEDYIAPKYDKKKKDKGSSVSKKEVSDQGQTKKKKYVNLYSQEGQSRDVVLLKGRHKCECQAAKHRLINNCLKCGRIVCQQEGSGPCLFCGNLVCSREEQELLHSGSKQSSHLLQKLMDQKVEGYEAAIEQRNRLLEYDRTSEKRTKVIDDESDYFCTNSVWLSTAEREKMRKKEEEMQARKHQYRKNQVVTLDIGLKRMVESKPEDLDLYEVDEVLQDISNHMKSSDSTYQYQGDNSDPSSNIQLVYDEKVVLQLERGPRNIYNILDSSQTTRIQDKEYLEMVDAGLCLSLHQPWASLLVCGIKVHEGRNWYSSHRGCLWIASAAKAPTEQDIHEAEEIYRLVQGTSVFPLTYPTSCLVGCVNIVNCLPQEEYRLKYKDGESQSPFVFICDNPQELPIRFPITGQHKIYKLDSHIHQAAVKALQRIAKIKADKNSQSLLRNS